MLAIRNRGDYRHFPQKFWRKSLFFYFGWPPMSEPHWVDSRLHDDWPSSSSRQIILKRNRNIEHTYFYKNKLNSCRLVVVIKHTLVPYVFIEFLSGDNRCYKFSHTKTRCGYCFIDNKKLADHVRYACWPAGRHALGGGVSAMERALSLWSRRCKDLLEPLSDECYWF